MWVGSDGQKGGKQKLKAPVMDLPLCPGRGGGESSCRAPGVGGTATRPLAFPRSKQFTLSAYSCHLTALKWSPFRMKWLTICISNIRDS